MLSVITSAFLVFELIEGRTYGWWLATDGLTLGDWVWPLALSPVPIAFVRWGLRRERAGTNLLALAGGSFLASGAGGSLGSALDGRLDAAGLPPEARDDVVAAVGDSAGAAMSGLGDRALAGYSSARARARKKRRTRSRTVAGGGSL
ncbi:hypothetical protein [Microcella frigidaquae]|uniref:Uncharacterized protein n=1 Tax=Microcella frigidaquae TaxID=424758 RepID=A0A840X6M5_9MICO|nr:hypothetical protein [Microcella frigidaquae]MBB5618193.1 hypothetical protein [Microcella frigidaquae]NHN44472.1 hypothetical protein [Microcella frigidaquae]